MNEVEARALQRWALHVTLAVLMVSVLFAGRGGPSAESSTRSSDDASGTAATTNITVIRGVTTGQPDTATLTVQAGTLFPISAAGRTFAGRSLLSMPSGSEAALSTERIASPSL